MANFDGFDLTVPSNTSSAALGDDEFRSVKSYLQNWFEQEHYATDGSSASAGVHKAGSARIYTQSAAPTAVNIGELWHDPDDDGLYVAEAAGTGNWQVVTNSISLGVANTWSALQTFTSATSANDIAVGGSFTGIVSGSTTLTADAGANAEKVITLNLVNENSALSLGDFIILSGYEAETIDFIASASIISSTGTIRANFWNTNPVSRQTIGAGTVINYLGFTRT